ncbi:unnamed protein product, partial [Ectocarpus sp. 12 AP-2014]
MRRKKLNENQMRALIDDLLEGSNKGKYAHGDIKRVAQQFGCCSKQVAAVWARYMDPKSAGIASLNLRNKCGGNSGRKGLELDVLREKLQHIPLKNSMIQRAITAQLGIGQPALKKNLAFRRS